MNSEKKESYVNRFTQMREDSDEWIPLAVKKELKEPMTAEEIDRYEYLTEKRAEESRRMIADDKREEIISFLKFIGIVILIGGISAVLIILGIVHKQ